MDDYDLRAVGERVRWLRGKHKVARAALARLCGRDDKTVWRWEHGRALPDTHSVLAICRTYGVSADWLLRGTPVTEAAP